ncbi:Cytochrome c oxidase assembly protein cox11, mitochondrial [Arthrobotrys musiformis]|uniref:Cytochrome c oxidase assembly protein cox11, mitochondrial n=1 Tax=Arthrobotrys musiformis TaxID=47236 RepID=A0AAV9W9E1_9PEZI
MVRVFPPLSKAGLARTGGLADLLGKLYRQPSQTCLYRHLQPGPQQASRFFTTLPPRFQRPKAYPDYSKVYGKRNTSILYYSISVIIGVTGFSYAAVPFYRAICQRTGYGGTPITDQTRFTADKLVPVDPLLHRRLRITFNGSVSDALQWKFTPQQREVRVLPGETALAFYTATNKSDEDIVGVATYSVTPAQVAPYFSKIQCFCFEEQKLLKGETVDMPVFFFIDPEFVKDPQMKGIDTITLSYTFFKARYDDHGNLKITPTVQR